LSPDTSEEVLRRIRESVDAPEKFILLNRIERALSNLRNLGNVGDVSTILKHQSENDEEHAAASYSLVNGFIWAIPVIGFIGTVLGLSQSMAAFGGTLRSASEISALKGSLTEVTGGLATAFETTLVALVAALVLQLALTILQNRENTFLDACNDYCHAHIASRLRLIR
jgi:biopolymer transport protein ExbB/TolQ